MNDIKLVFRERISRRDSHDMIIMMAKYSNIYEKQTLRTDAEVKRYLESQGVGLDFLVEHCRTFSNNVLCLENLVPSTVSTFGGGTISLINKETEKVIESVTGPGTLSVSTYWTLFEQCIQYRNNAVKKNSFSEFQSSVTNGISSIEAFLNFIAFVWNERNPEEPLEDSKANRKSIDNKIDIWIPQITNGKKIDKSIRFWSDYKRLCEIRDDLTIHPKKIGIGYSLQELADKINLMKTGIAEFLIQLHLITKKKIPAIIIRGYYAPLVELKVIDSNIY